MIKNDKKIFDKKFLWSKNFFMMLKKNLAENFFKKLNKILKDKIKYKTNINYKYQD